MSVETAAVTAQSSQQPIPSKYPHIYWIDLRADGTLTECAVLKKDDLGNIHFINLQWLDHTDKLRLRDIIMNRNASYLPLWELMQQTTLGNGINALTYFHQLVKVKTATGTIMDPSAGTIGFNGSAGTIRAPQPVPAAPTGRVGQV